MKKLFFVILFCLCGSFATMAQVTKVVSGAVIDKQGNPLPGAMVAVPNGADAAVVDADGTFSIEVPIWSKSLEAQYAGMKDKKMKIKDEEMIFKMKPAIKNQWFINAVIDMNYDGYYLTDHMYAGVMAGYLGKWGGFLKVSSYIIGGNELAFYPSATIGVTKRFCRWLHMYLGLGVAPHYRYYYTYEYRFPEVRTYIHESEYYAAAGEVGFIIKPTMHLNVNLGFSVYASGCPGLQLGLGYSF